MQEKFFKIKINDREFTIESDLEQFREVGKNNAVINNRIPVAQFRYNNGKWFILWDKDDNEYYHPEEQHTVSSIPLSVQWLEVVFIDDQAPEKEYLDLIILLSESLSIIRNRCLNNKFRKSDTNIKKWLTQFNKS